MKPAVAVSHLSFGYDSRRVLEDVNIEIFPNTLTMCLGRNGAGKSTFIRLIGGMIPHREGEITIDGTDIKRLPPRMRARKISYMSQNHQPVFPFTVGDVVLTGRAGYVSFIPKKEDSEVALHMMERVGIDHLRDRYYTELSGGEQQLVMIARSLAQQPEILLLDEPTSHLDYNNQVAVLSLLKQLVAEGLAVVAVLHDPNMSLLFGDDFLFVLEKRVIREESREPWHSPLLKKIYPGKLVSIPYNGRALLAPDII
jgi:iron complex transport system ATP-binding protein